jgi:hypothetical protein
VREIQWVCDSKEFGGPKVLDPALRKPTSALIVTEHRSCQTPESCFWGFLKDSVVRYFQRETK